MSATRLGDIKQRLERLTFAREALSERATEKASQATKRRLVRKLNAAEEAMEQHAAQDLALFVEAMERMGACYEAGDGRVTVEMTRWLQDRGLL